MAVIRVCRIYETIESKAVMVQEVFMGDSDVIVSKTNLKGHITYANHVFRKISSFEESELLGQPHSMIRHPDMPRCIFKLLWDKLGADEEVFAYVKNICKNGDYYWVFAHVTPSFDLGGEKVGYHSNRRKPDSASVELIEILYSYLLDIEKSASDSKQGMHQAYDILTNLIAEYGVSYDQFIFEFTRYFSKADLESSLLNFKLAS